MSTHASPEIESTTGTDADADADTDANEVDDENAADVRALVADLRDEVASLRDRVDELEAENEQLRERVADVEQHQAETATVRWSGINPRNIKIESAEADQFVEPYVAITEKADHETVDTLWERLEQLENGEAEVIVRGGMESEALPIERKVAERRAGGGDDLRKNERRASIVFPEFAKKGHVVGGAKKILETREVRDILAENTNKSTWSTKLVHRVMEKLATLTSPYDDTDRRHPEDEANLITFEKDRHGNRRIAAAIDEWEQFRDERRDD